MEWQDHYDSLIVFWAEHYGRDPKQVKRQIRVESDFVPNAVSGPGAKGLMQFMPETWMEQTNRGSDPFNPETNIMAGCKYMKWLESETGSLELALAAYNCGIGRVKTEMSRSFGGNEGVLQQLPEETQQYVQKCMEYAEETIHA
jgi:soluble lytic murein transglycosylase-like protein